MSETLTFLQLLFRDKPEHLFVLAWTRHNKKSYWFLNTEKLAEWLRKLPPQDVYVSAGLSARDYGPTKRCVADQVVAIPSFSADFDLDGDAHKGKKYPRTEEDALAILPPEFPPTVIVRSGHGLQVWWCFEYTVLFKDEYDRYRAARLSEQWNRYLQFRASANGWTIDSTYDLSRIMRVPGTTNTKQENAHVPVTIHSLPGHRYTLERFEEFLAQYPSVQRDPVRAARAIDPVPTPPREISKDLIVTHDREFDPQILALLLEADSKFRETWTETRTLGDGMNDLSASGYDFACCIFGCQCGFTDQQMADVIIQRRRLRGHQAIRLDKITRTISRARSRYTKEQMEPLFVPGLDPEPGSLALAAGINGIVPVPVEASSPLAVATMPAPSPEPVIDKIAICRQFAEAISIPVIRIEQQRGEVAIWRFHMEDGGQLVIKNANTLQSFSHFSASLLSQLGKVIPRKIKPEHWTRVYVPLIVSATIFIASAPENSEEETVKLAIDSYLDERGCVEDRNHLEGQRLKSDPFAYAGRIAISSIDLRNWIHREWDIRFDLPLLTNILSRMGAEQRKFSIRNGASSQSRWLLGPGHKPEAYINLNRQLPEKKEQGPQWPRPN